MSYEVPRMEGDDDLDFGSHAAGGWPRWEAFVRQSGALAHVHSESVHAADAETALLNARDAFVRRVEGVSLWVVPAAAISHWDSDNPVSGAAAGPDAGEAVLWEIFVRHRRGLAHVHAGSLYARGVAEVLTKARSVFVPRSEGVSVWVLPSTQVHAADPDEAEAFFAPFADKDYRYPTHYDIPEDVGYM